MRTVKLDAVGHPVTLTIDETDHIGRMITTRKDFYERDLLDDAAARLDTAPNGCIIDVGAHIGNHSVFLAAATGRAVHALEPYRPTYAILYGNVADNSAPVTTYPLAAGKAHETGTVLTPREGNSGTTAITAGSGAVQIVPIDDLIPDERVALMKIDTEDSAGGIPVTDIIAGAQRILTEERPVLYVEGDRADIAAVLPDGYEWFGTFGKTPTHGFRWSM